MLDINNQSIILFDGVCGLCHWAVRFIIKHDPKNRFVFASLQSDEAKAILLKKQVKNNLNTIIFIEKGTIYTKSTAVLKIAKHLNNGLSLPYFFIIIPRFIRDFFYEMVAKNRYLWFGKKEQCSLPLKELQERFL